MQQEKKYIAKFKKKIKNMRDARLFSTKILII